MFRAATACKRVNALVHGLENGNLTMVACSSRSCCCFAHTGNQDITVSEFMQMTYGYKYSFRFWTILILIAYVAFFRVLGVLALRYVSFLRR